MVNFFFFAERGWGLGAVKVGCGTVDLNEVLIS